MHRQRTVVPATGFHVVHVIAKAPQAHRRMLDPSGEVPHDPRGVGLVVITPLGQPQPVAIGDAAALPLDRQRRFLPLGIEVVRRQRVQPGAGIVGAAVAGAVVTDQPRITGPADGAIALAGGRGIQADTPRHAPVGLQGMHGFRRGVASAASIAGAGGNQPGQDITPRLHLGIAEKVLGQHVEPELLPQRGLLIGRHQQGGQRAATP
ncbi:hypothetical protein D9M70_402680 [compost metagenome]